MQAPITAAVCLASIAISGLAWFSDQQLPFAIDMRGFFLVPWTPITSTFQHANVLHLFFNLTWMWSFGWWLEQRIGTLRFLALFLFLALGSSAAEFAWNIGGVGLSGVVYGLFGFLWMRSRRERDYGDLVGEHVQQIFVVWFFACIALTWMDWLRIANVAHGAGAVLGAGVGWVCNARGARRGAALAALATTFAICLLGATVARPFVNHGRGLSLTLSQRAFDAVRDGDTAVALSLAEEAVDRDPENGSAQWSLGVAQVLGGSVDAGLASLKKADELGVRTLSPEALWLETMQQRLSNSAAAGNWQDLAQLAQRVIDLDPRRAWAWTQLGNGLSRTGAEARACAAFEQAYKLDPGPDHIPANFAWAKVQRARLAIEAGDLRTAREQLKAGLSLQPGDAYLLQLQRTVGSGANAPR